MKRTTIFFLLAAIALSTASCEKYLDKKSDLTYVIPTSVKDAQALLDNSTLMNTSGTNYEIASSDDYFTPDAALNTLGVGEVQTYQWIPKVYAFSNDWSTSYSAVYVANLALETLGKNERTAAGGSDYDNAKGSALFYRAYHLFNVAMTHTKGYDSTTAATDLGIVLRLNSDANERSVRASVKASYEQILADAKAAAELLPAQALLTMRPNKAAAYGLLARVYLSMGAYDEASAAATQSLQSKNVLLDYKTDVSASSSTPIPKYNKETLFYAVSYTTFVLAAYNFYGFVDSALYASYDLNDVRKTAFFEKSGNYYTFKGNYTGDFLFFAGITTSEVLLTRAEALARKGNRVDALADLNLLLKNRYNASFTPVTATDANDALNKILLERRKELLFRGLRWDDLKRLNRKGANIVPKRMYNGQTYTLPVGDKRYALPLPKDIVDLGIPQNP